MNTDLRRIAIRIAQFAICFGLACRLVAAQEVRALWIVRTTLTSPEKIRQLVASAADNGFNDFTARPSELNPDGAYLERIRRAAF